jgi:hypothetical protein
VEQIADMLDELNQSANNLLHRALLNLRKEWNTFPSTTTTTTTTTPITHYKFILNKLKKS